ncbi:MAG: hypothetical protein WC815_00825 [Vicinamibacterales bacterium]|jgi:hypothetical protein
MDEAPKPGDPFAEITAMQKVAEALKSLDTAAIGRVLQWAANHWSVPTPQVITGASIPSTAKMPAPIVSADAPPPKYTDLGELFAAASPAADTDRVLVVGYWLQFIEGRSDLASFDVNKELKNLGHGVANVTTAFDNLKARKPAPVIQLKKAGTSKQARKTYKLTLAGKQAVEAMLPPQ